MKPEEFSNQFDVLYNSITSNQAPGLDEYEKSVFLTKAQNEVLLSYFDPRKNKVQEGYDGSQRRQIDFSNITKVHTECKEFKVVFQRNDMHPIPYIPDAKVFQTVDDFLNVLEKASYDEKTSTYTVINTNTMGLIVGGLKDSPLDVSSDGDTYTVKAFNEALFDLRKNSVSVTIPDMLLFINEKTVVSRNGKEIELVTIPIQFQEYDRLMSKPFKRPVKYQAWRIINNSQKNKADLVVGPSDTILKYSIRYLKKPNPIIVGNLDGLEIEGFSDVTECELDPILHPEILQRAVEQAKAAYSGTLQDTVSLGQVSQTDIGILTQSR